MKTSAKLVVAIIAAAVITSPSLPAQGPGQGGGRGPGPGGGPGARLCSVPSLLLSLPIEPLSGPERRFLLYVREEEKLARDVYLSLYETWNRKVFLKIARSEKGHMDWIKVLIDRYELPDPVASHGLGTFENRGFQELYRELVILGSDSLITALEIGAMIEEKNIYDLMVKGLRRADNQDLRALYLNLAKGSRNHLRTFHRLLDARGVVYEPEWLSDETYFGIVSTPIEKGIVDLEGEWICGGRRQGRID